MDTLSEDRVYARAVRLLAIRDAVAEAFNGTKHPVVPPDDSRTIVRLLRCALAAIPGSFGVIAGGMAIQEHGYMRWAEDLAIVIDAEHHSQIIDYYCANGFVREGEFTIRKPDTNTRLTALREGCPQKNGRFPLPHPSELGSNGDFATLAGVIRMKLDCDGQFSHQADGVELLKRRLNEIDQLRRSLPGELHTEFDQMVGHARREAR